MKKPIFYALAIISSSLPLYATSESLTEEMKNDLKKYINEIPAIGMIMDKVDYDGIQLSNFKFLNEKKYVVCHPDEKVTAMVDYEIDSDQLPTFHLHHFIYGLDPSGPQGCLVKTLGVFDSSGNAKFTLKAPKDKGVYQIRFCHGQGVTHEKAQEIWWKKGNPPAKTVMGILVVE